MSDRVPERKSETSTPAAAPRGAVATQGGTRGPVARPAVPAIREPLKAETAIEAAVATAITEQARTAAESGHATASAAPVPVAAPDPAPVLPPPAPPTTTTMTTPTTTKSTMERVMTTAEEMLAFGQGNVEAFVKSSQIWASGLQDLGRHVAQSAQAQFDGTMSTMKALASVKSVHEAFELQSAAARTALEKAVQDGGKLTDASVKLAEQTMAPLTARVSAVAERFGRVAA